MRDAKANAPEDYAWPRILSRRRSSRPLRCGPASSRARLLDRVAECTRRRLTLLTAPAGSGKATLLAQWGAAPREHAVAWLSIDAVDDAPIHFFRLLTASVEAAIPGAGSGALALLRSSFHPSARSVAAALLNDLTDRERDLVLVLDGYHLIGSGSIHDAMALILDRLWTLLSPVSVLVVAWYLRSKIDGFFHYQRMREVDWVLETAFAAFRDNPDRLEPPFEMPGPREARPAGVRGHR